MKLIDKVKLIKEIKIPHLSVCEDVDEHFHYWENNVNENKEDCCNLRL